MGKKLIATSGSQVQATPWEKGKIIVGFFLSADVLPKCDSRKLNFDAGYDNGPVAVWETVSLALQVSQMKVGTYYKIVCNGKGEPFKHKETGKMVSAWGFEVEEAEDEAEQQRWNQEYRHYVAGGGK